MISTITVLDITPVPKQIMCTEVNSAMGLQVTAANKRKHDITFEGKDINTYTASPPPIKACKWSINNNNYIDAIEEDILKNCIVEEKSEENKQENEDIKSIIKDNKVETTKSKKSTTNIIKKNSSNNKYNTNETTSLGKSGKYTKEATTKAAKKLNCFTTLISITTATSTVAETITTTTTRTSSNTVSLLQLKPEISATTPLPPTSSTPVPEDSIAKLEVVAATPLTEPWNSTVANAEPVDCISKLQAVAVPTDPWGSVGTRSTLATTLLNSDELDDDDDDFEDDYEDDESLIPTYCSLRYHPFSSTGGGGGNTLTRTNNAYVPSNSYCVTRPNYYSEPFPQQNCARTNNSPQMRLLGPTGNSSFQWTSNMNQYYMMPESAYTVQSQEQQPPQQQQTIRCAENGKSYLELGCSSSLTTSPTTPTSAQILHHQNGISSAPNCGFVPMSPSHAALKRCCEARSGAVWCAATTNSSKNCYKDIRLKIRNLSMFKLSRFRQVSEQSLYRSVLICNTLKRIDREIEAEAKEMHHAAAAAAVAHAQAAAAAAQHHGGGATSYNHHNNATTHHHLTTTANHHMQHQQQQQQHHLQQHQQQMHQHNQDYAPAVINSARMTNVEYQVQQQQHIQQQQQQHYQQHYLAQNGTSGEHLDAPNTTGSSSGGGGGGISGFFNTSMQQKSTHLLLNNNNNNNNNTNNNNNNNNSNNCDTATITTAAATTTATTSISNNGIHQYDHYPFRDSQSGRATPYPCQFVSVSTTATSTPTSTQSLTAAATSSIAAITSTTVKSAATSALANTTTTTTINNNNNNNIVIIDTLEAEASNPTVTATVEFVEDVDATRSSSINWSSVLSLSSQSALDPLNNNDLFAILPPATNPAIAVPVPVSSTSTTAVALSSVAANTSSVTTTRVAATSVATNTTATFTTLSTISSATDSLSSTYNTTNNSSWEYGFLDMEFGLGTEFTELMPPSCKLSSDDLFKNALTPVSTSRYSSVHENELEQPAHIMVGS